MGIKALYPPSPYPPKGPYDVIIKQTHKPTGEPIAPQKNTHRLQYPLIKEYSLNHIRDPTIIGSIIMKATPGLSNNGFWAILIPRAILSTEFCG